MDDKQKHWSYTPDNTIPKPTGEEIHKELEKKFMDEYQRRSGRTTRIIDNWVQQFFEGGFVSCIDHADTEAARAKAMRTFILRLENEHNINQNEIAVSIKNATVVWNKYPRNQEGLGQVLIKPRRAGYNAGIMEQIKTTDSIAVYGTGGRLTEKDMESAMAAFYNPDYYGVKRGGRKKEVDPGALSFEEQDKFFEAEKFRKQYPLVKEEVNEKPPVVEKEKPTGIFKKREL